MESLGAFVDAGIEDRMPETPVFHIQTFGGYLNECSVEVVSVGRGDNRDTEEGRLRFADFDVVAKDVTPDFSEDTPRYHCLLI
jgi:hypothetical protein